MNKRMKRLLAFLAILMVGSLLIAACAPAATEAPEVEEPQAPEAEEPSVEEPEDPAVSEIVGAYGIPWGFETLDPSASTEIEMVVLMNTYETLAYTPEYDTSTALPLLATSWESNEEGTEWVFHLREGVKFHDGSEFTAEAVKYSFERTWRMELGASYLLDPIEEMVIIDDYTIQFNLSYAAPMDIIAASAYGVYIMNPRIVAEVAHDSEDWFNEGNDAGTGPYVTESYEVGTYTIMKKFDDYWDGHKPRSFDRVIVNIIEDALVLQQHIEAGEADITWGLPTENLELLAANPDINVIDENTFIVHFIHINTQKPPLDDKLVRQAMAYTFPYDDMITYGLDGYGVEAVTLVPKGAWGFCDTCFTYSYDLDKARELLTEAGYPDGGLEFEAVVFTGSFIKEQALELWAGELNKVGITMRIIPMQGEAAYALLRSGPEEAPNFLGFSWWQDIVHPAAFLTSSFACEEEAYFNFSYWCNEEFDQYLNDAWPISASDREASILLYDEAQKVLIEEAPGIFLWQEVKNWFVRADVEGFVPNPAYTNTVFWKNLTRTE
jgi:peptide/nickel transport system substrate-binding protein